MNKSNGKIQELANIASILNELRYRMKNLSKDDIDNDRDIKLATEIKMLEELFDTLTEGTQKNPSIWVAGLKRGLAKISY